MERIRQGQKIQARFPKISVNTESIDIAGDFISSPDSVLVELTAHVRKPGESFKEIPFTLQSGNSQSLKITGIEKGSTIELFLSTKDSKGFQKMGPGMLHSL